MKLDFSTAASDIDVIGKCANCGVEYHIHKYESEISQEEKRLIKIIEGLVKERHKNSGALQEYVWQDFKQKNNI